MSNQAELRYRGHERFDVVLPARIRVAAPMRSSVRLSKAVGGPEGWIDADVHDMSRHGLGISCVLFLPRKALIEVEIFGLAGSASAPILRASARVQRVVMTDRRPAYLLGVTFESMPPEQMERLESFLQTLGDESPKPAGGQAHA